MENSKNAYILVYEKVRKAPIRLQFNSMAELGAVMSKVGVAWEMESVVKEEAGSGSKEKFVL